MRLSPAAHAAFSLAGREADDLQSALLDVEHLVLGLCKVEVLRHVRDDQLEGVSSAEAKALRTETTAFATALERAGLDLARGRRRLRGLWQESHPVRQAFTGHRTPRCREVCTQAEAEPGPVGLASLWRAALGEPSVLLDRLLAELPRERGALVAAVAGLAAVGAGAEVPARAGSRLARYGRDLTQLAREGRLQRALGRDEEARQVARILLQAKKGNAVLVGDPGVGKTAIVEDLALRLIDPEAPRGLRGLTLVELSLGALVAGTKHRGDLEERLQEVLGEAERDRSLVLFIDELHTLLGAGGASGGQDVASLLKPALARGLMRVIGATTADEYRRYLEADPALARRFQVVWVEEPSRDAALAILEGLRPGLEEHHGVHLARSALEKAVDLSVRYLPDLRLPDKAIDLLDQACARALLSTFSPRRQGEAARPAEVGGEQVAVVVAQRCRVPVERLTEAEGQRLLRMEAVLSERVLGQEAAVSAVAEGVRAARAGLRDARRPLGVFLFLGPTGTGKTELARALAGFLFGGEERLLRIDMSEYAERHSVARLLGAPPGYVGHEEGGQLTDAVRRHPCSVVLFDEIEKAHPDVFDLFLQIFDEGQLTDARGRRAPFADTVVVLTSNLGGAAVPAAEAPRIGLLREEPLPRAQAEDVAWDAYVARVRVAVGRVLRPELRNRIQKEVIFRPLGREVAGRILDKLMAELNGQLSLRGLSLVLSPEARTLLLDAGFSQDMGARALRRALREKLEEPLARRLLAPGPPPGPRVQVIPRAGELCFLTDEDELEGDGWPK